MPPIVVCLVAWGSGSRVFPLLASPPALCVCVWSSPPPSFLEHLHKHQGSVLHPDYKTAFPSFEDALHRLLPYHVYQGALPSPNDYHKGEASQDSPHRVPGVWRWVARTAEGTSEQMLAQLCKRHCRGGRMRPAPCVSSGQPPPSRQRPGLWTSSLPPQWTRSLRPSPRSC